jgi:membrane protease YdiL (CAAX protease family)
MARREERSHARDLSLLAPVRTIAWPPKSWNVWLTALVAVGAAIVYLAAAVVYFFVIVAFGVLHVSGRASPIPITQLLWAQFVAYVPLAWYLIYFVPRLARLTLHDLGLRAPTENEIRIGVKGAAVALIAGIAVSAFVDFLYPPRSEEEIMRAFASMHGPVEVIGCLLLIVVLGPIFEEFVFRFFLFNALDRYLPTAAAIVVNGVIFGAVHAVAVDQLISISIPIAVTGSILAYLYAKTRCIWVSVIAHAIFNAVSIAASVAFDSP